MSWLQISINTTKDHAEFAEDCLFTAGAQTITLTDAADQPILEPGQSYEYTSGCPLPTPFGSMQGTYQMVTNGGEPFDAVGERWGVVSEQLGESSGRRR